MADGDDMVAIGKPLVDLLKKTYEYTGEEMSEKDIGEKLEKACLKHEVVCLEEFLNIRLSKMEHV